METGKYIKTSVMTYGIHLVVSMVVILVLNTYEVLNGAVIKWLYIFPVLGLAVLLTFWAKKNKQNYQINVILLMASMFIFLVFTIRM